MPLCFLELTRLKMISFQSICLLVSWVCWSKGFIFFLYKKFVGQIYRVYIIYLQVLCILIGIFKWFCIVVSCIFCLNSNKFSFFFCPFYLWKWWRMYKEYLEVIFTKLYFSIDWKYFFLKPTFCKRLKYNFNVL